MFQISFLEDEVEKGRSTHGEESVYVEVVINEFTEKNIATIDVWSPAEYREQWIEGLKRLLSKSEINSLLVSDLSSPALYELPVLCWLMYRVNDNVYIQNTYLPHPRPEEPKNLTQIYSNIQPRKTQTDEGDSISEWKVSLEDVTDFLSRLELQTH